MIKTILRNQVEKQFTEMDFIRLLGFDPFKWRFIRRHWDASSKLLDVTLEEIPESERDEEHLSVEEIDELYGEKND